MKIDFPHWFPLPRRAIRSAGLLALALSFTACRALFAQSPPPTPPFDQMRVTVLSQVADYLSALKRDPFRTWRGANGSEFAGTYLRHEKQGTHVVIRDTKDKEFVVPVEKFCEMDRTYLDARLKLQLGQIPPFLPGDGKSASPVAPAGLKPQPARVNRTMPEMDFSRMGVSFDKVTDKALVSALLWWDVIGWLPVPKGKDLEDKAKWLSRRIRVEDFEDDKDFSIEGKAVRALTDYGEKELKDVAVLKCKSSTEEEYSAEKITEWLSGADICFLILDRHEGKTEKGYRFLVVTAVNGPRINVYLDGMNHELEVKRGTDREGQVVTEFHFVDEDKVPNWLRKSHFGGEVFRSLRVSGHVFTEPGKPVPVPEHMPRRAAAAKGLADLPAHALQTTLVLGKRNMDGHLVAADDDGFWFWEGGTLQWYRVSLLDGPSAERVLKWRRERGQTVKAGARE